MSIPEDFILLFELNIFRFLPALITAQMFMGPLVLSLSFSAIGIMIVFLCTTSSRRTILFICAGLRTLSFALCMSILICAMAIGRKLEATDPSYPIRWPPMIRSATKIESWRSGQIDWLIGSLLHLLVIGIDLHYIQNINDSSRDDLMDNDML